MKTPDLKSEQKTPNASDASKDIQNKNNTFNEKTKVNPSSEELRLIDEKNMVGQPMGNHIQNSNFKHQTPTDKTNEKNFSEGDSNSMKGKQQQAETPHGKVGQPIGSKIENKSSSVKPQSN